MDERNLRQLMGTISDPIKPKKEVLWQIILLEFLKLNPPDEAVLKLREAFNISYFGHLYTPLRQSGDAYILHIVRANIRMIWRQNRLETYNLQAILYEITHDCFEDAKRSKRNRALLEHEVTKRLGAKTTFGTLTLTKHKERGETNEQYFLRMLKTTIWEVIWAKFEDRIDNIVTIGSMGYQSAITKIEETEFWFPLLRDRLRLLIEREIDIGRLGRTYRTLPDDLFCHLHQELVQQKRKLRPK